ncbi:hypothetical protein GCM10027176_58140 [Actinoallomurus bryophytorum]
MTSLARLWAAQTIADVCHRLLSVVEMDGADYVLTRGGRPIALLRETERDDPWVSCEFRAFPAFESVRPVLQAAREEDTWGAVLRVRLLRLRLRSTNGAPTIRRLRLVVDGDTARFRFALGLFGLWRFRRWARHQMSAGLG